MDLVFKKNKYLRFHFMPFWQVYTYCKDVFFCDELYTEINNKGILRVLGQGWTDCIPGCHSHSTMVCTCAFGIVLPGSDTSVYIMHPWNDKEHCVPMFNVSGNCTPVNSLVCLSKLLQLCYWISFMYRCFCCVVYLLPTLP